MRASLGLAACYTAASTAATIANSTAGVAAVRLPLSCGAAFGGGALMVPKAARALSSSVAVRGDAGAAAGVAAGACEPCISWFSKAPVAVPFSAAAAATSKSGPFGIVHASMPARFGTNGSTGTKLGHKHDWISACAFVQYKRSTIRALHRAGINL